MNPLELASSLQHRRITRRQMLWLLGASALSGCASSPVGGGSILVGQSRKERSPSRSRILIPPYSLRTSPASSSTFSA